MLLETRLFKIVVYGNELEFIFVKVKFSSNNNSSSNVKFQFNSINN